MTIRTLPLAAAILVALAIPIDAPAQEPAPGDEQQQPRIQIDLRQILDEARAAFRAGNLQRAVGLYRVILRFSPENRVARIELSIVLATIGERESAARIISDIDTDGLDPDVIDLIGRLAGPDKLTFFLVPELFLDTNINGQTRDSTVTFPGGTLLLNDDARGTQGYGYGFTAGANYRLSDANPRLTLTSGVSLRDFERGRDDEQSAFLSLSMGFDIGEFALTPALSTVYRYDDWVPREVEIGGGLAAATNFGPVRNTLGGRYRRLNGQRDGGSRFDRDIYEVYDVISFGFGGIAWRFDERYTFEDWDHRQDFDNWEFQSGLDTTFVETPWVVPTLGGSYTHREFQNPAAFFAVERQDREYEGHLELLFREIDLFGSSPFIRYEYTDVSSNIGLFDHDRHEFSVGVRAISW